MQLARNVEWIRGVAFMVSVAALAMPFIVPSDAMARDGTTRPVRSLIEQRHDKVVLQKWDFSCGAAALATILRYQHGVNVDERTIVKWMLSHGDPNLVVSRLGFSMLDLKKFLEAHGYEASGYGNLTLEQLFELGSAIVPIQIYDYAHFVVVRGAADGRMLLADPQFGNRTMPIAEFEKIWVKHSAFVVERTDGKRVKDQLPAGADDLLAPDAATVRQAIR